MSYLSFSGLVFFLAQRMREGVGFFFSNLADYVTRPSSKGKPTDPKLREEVKECQVVVVCSL